MLEEEDLLVPMSDGSSVKLNREEWPLLVFGYADSHQGSIKAPERLMSAAIRVRKHADGWAIVLGEADFESARSGEWNDSWSAWVILAPGDDIANGVGRVKEELLAALEKSSCNEKETILAHIREAAGNCIWNLSKV